jgi:LacI family transcriptional regulator
LETVRGENGFSDAPTIVDVAQLAGVSRSTTARVLGGYGSASAKARAKVNAAAEALNYRANELARSMSTGRSKSIGVVVADIRNPFFATATRGMTDASRSAGFEVLLANTDEDLEAERTAVRLLLDKRVDGLVVAPSSPIGSEHLRDAQDSGVPVVLLDRKVRGLRADAVLADSIGAAYDATTRFVDAGHRRIGLVTVATESRDTGSNLSSAISDRIAGYKRALENFGIAFDARLVPIGGPQPLTAHDRVRQLLSLKTPPTALLATDSLVALDIIDMAKEYGLRIGHDLSLVAWDDAQWTHALTPPLSVVSQPMYELGEMAVKVLLKRIEGMAGRPRTQLLQTTFIDRESIAIKNRSATVGASSPTRKRSAPLETSILNADGGAVGRAKTVNDK